MSRCILAQDKACYICGCDGTPGFKENCGGEHVECNKWIAKNNDIYDDNVRIFKITDQCLTHSNFRSLHSEQESYLRMRMKINNDQHTTIPTGNFRQLLDCDVCREKINQISDTLVNYDVNK